ncbi:MAG TPA: RHS repeat-associated core domain-containing protein, partial [Pyrinomonadaceae bacterium]
LAWTIQAFDALGRVISVTTPDNAVVTTSYSGNSVTVTDQAGKARRSVSDALGRLLEVYEDPNGLNHQTTYLYDVLDNLVKVTQGSQQRFFMYDSLKRLLRARNPEHTTRPSLSLSDPLTGNSAWSVAYQYDAGSNLTQRTDARGVMATYGYDALNRSTSIDYSDATPDVFRQYDLAVKGIGRLSQTWQSGSITAATYIDSYDALGRPLVQRQRYETAGVWSSSYQTTRSYNLAGGVTAQVYPSGHTVTYTYDAAGRASSFSGNLGDGTTRTYSTAITYDTLGGVRQEQFGTQTPLYHKKHYNRRGQLFDVRLSTVSWTTDQWNWNRGALVNYYSANYAWEGDPATSAGPDNNGNVLRQQHWVPTDDAISSYNYTQDTYTYDSLNRLQSAVEVHGTPASQSAQDYAQMLTYDRWGNRTINPASWGVGINTKQFTVDPATNRLGVPAGQPGVLTYDEAGNLTVDTYTGTGARTYDAENRMLTAADNTGQTSRYSYNADGQRVRRQIAASQEEWQIYGMEGELLAEYKASSPPSAPEKEYGYRNGQLLVTATGRFNVALAANGAVATASSAHTCCGFSTTGAINGNNRGPWGNGEGWNDATPNSVPDWIQVEFAGDKTIDEINVFSLHDNYTVENTPTETQTFSLYGLQSFDVQYWNGSSWVTVPGGSVTGNNKVWRKFTFAPITTRKIRVWINQVPDSWSRVVEIQAFGTSAGGEKIQWLVPDHLGTPRMVIDQTGSLANIKRHDYLPFGEELFAPVGARTTAQGYASGDGIRQQFTLKERDIETNLDYFGARYYGNQLGRFTSVDPLIASGRISLPQSWNRYAYALNNALRLIDPDGLMDIDANKDEQKKRTQQQQQGQPAQTPRSSPSQPVGPVQTPTGLEIKLAMEANTMVNVPFGGSLFTGVGGFLELTPTDQNGKPIPNVVVIESVSPGDTIQAAGPVTSPSGTVTDLVGSGERHPASQPKTMEQAAEIIVPRLDNPRTIKQTHQMAILSPSSAIMAIATHTRTLTNVDSSGNLVNNIKGNRKVNNYTITEVSEPTIVQKPIVMCPRF